MYFVFTKSLQYCVGLQDLLLHPLSNTVSDGTQVLQYELCCLRLPCPALSADDTGLVLSLVLQVVQCCFCCCKHVWRHVTELRPTVFVYSTLQKSLTSLLPFF